MPHRPMHGAALAALISAAMLPAAALAQEPGRPDFSGFYTLPFGGDVSAPDETLMALVAPNTVFVDDAGAVELGVGDYGGLEPKPDALAAAQAWRPEDDMTISRTCETPGVIYSMQGPFPIKIHQGTEMLVMQLEYFDITRIVFLDGREPPPASAPHTKMGYSIGRWEGDILVVETTHLAASTILNNGLNHGEQATMIERFRLSEDGTRLLSTQEFEDPESLHNRGLRIINWNRSAEEDYVFPYDCDPAFGANYGVFDLD